jgi:dienelactone hydrolase
VKDRPSKAPVKLSRRQLGLAALASTSMAQDLRSDAKYSGSLDGFESKVDLTTFDPVAWTRKRWESAPLRLTYSAATAKETLAWQKKLRAKLVELVGGFPSERRPLNPKLLETREFPSYRREKFVLTTRPGVSLLAYQLTPKDAAAKAPAVICIPGHGRGVDDIVGVDSDGADRTNKAGYQHDFAIQAAQQGLITIAIEPMGFGCRRDQTTKARGLATSACQPSAGAALLLGETMVGWRVWDVMRVIDWMETRPGIDAAKIGCMGISGGGTITLFGAALEPRIRVAYVSGYLNTFRDSILSLSHCIDNYVPGILNWAEMYDVAGLIAPRPLFSESGDQDRIFPVEASRESFERVRRVYRTLSAEDRCQQEIFDGEHVFHGARGLPFLRQWLA